VGKCIGAGGPGEDRDPARGATAEVCHYHLPRGQGARRLVAMADRRFPHPDTRPEGTHRMIQAAAHALFLSAVCVVLAAVSGCVAAYDPAIPPRFALTTRAEEVGTSRERPVRFKPKPVAAAEPVAAPAVIQPSVQPDPPPPVVAPPVAFPNTPAGRQFKWFTDILAGGGTRDKDLDGRFAPAFLEQVPLARVRDIARQWRRDQLADGPVELVRIDPDATPTRLTAIVRGKVTNLHTQIRLGVDEAGLITMLWMGPVADMARGAIPTWGRLGDKLAEMPGSVSLSVCEVPGGGVPLKEVYGYGGDRRLAIGSTFKLFILGALAEEIAAGTLSWDTELPIRDDLKSLPSGRMQLEPEKTEFPIKRYAELMISISDNTAADHLLRRVGRDKVEAYMARFSGGPAGSRPFLSTMEMFKIKLGADRTLADRYAKADEAARRAMLAPGGEVEQSQPSLAAAAMWKAPYEIERVEWFASAMELCRVMADLHRLEQLPGMEPLRAMLRINPGLQFDPDMWTSVAYKGGSEPGVLNMTWLLERKDGRWFTVSIGWNDAKKDVDVRKMAEMAGAAVGLLGGVE